MPRLHRLPFMTLTRDIHSKRLPTITTNNPVRDIILNNLPTAIISSRGKGINNLLMVTINNQARDTILTSLPTVIINSRGKGISSQAMATINSLTRDTSSPTVAIIRSRDMASKVCQARPAATLWLQARRSTRLPAATV